MHLICGCVRGQKISIEYNIETLQIHQVLLLNPPKVLRRRLKGWPFLQLAQSGWFCRASMPRLQPRHLKASPLVFSNGGERGRESCWLHAGGPSLAHKLWGINEIPEQELVMTGSDAAVKSKSGIPTCWNKIQSFGGTHEKLKEGILLRAGRWRKT
jgi:hypothetical protein